MRIFKGKPVDENPEFLRRAKPLINRIVWALQAQENTNLDHVASRIILKVPKGYLKLIHRRKIDLGFKSLETYLLSLLDKDLSITRVTRK